MVEPDYQPEKPSFTPLPVYHSVRDHIVNQQPILYRGVHQAESWQIESPGAAVADEGARFGRAQRFDDGLRFRAHGTSVAIRWRPADGSAWRIKRLELSSGQAGD